MNKKIIQYFLFSLILFGCFFFVNSCSAVVSIPDGVHTAANSKVYNSGNYVILQGSDGNFYFPECYYQESNHSLDKNWQIVYGTKGYNCYMLTSPGYYTIKLRQYNGSDNPVVLQAPTGVSTNSRIHFDLDNITLKIVYSSKDVLFLRDESTDLTSGYSAGDIFFSAPYGSISIPGVINFIHDKAYTWSKPYYVGIVYSETEIEEGYNLQYRIADGAWIDVENGVCPEVYISENCTLYARLYNFSIDDERLATSLDITNIDNISPTVPTFINVVKDDYLGVTVNCGGSSDNESGVIGYQVSINNGVNWSKTFLSEYTIKGLTADTNSIIYCRAVDWVGNYSSSYSIEYIPNYTTVSNDIENTLENNFGTSWVDNLSTSSEFIKDFLMSVPEFFDVIVYFLNCFPNWLVAPIIFGISFIIILAIIKFVKG